MLSPLSETLIFVYLPLNPMRQIDDITGDRSLPVRHERTSDGSIYSGLEIVLAIDGFFDDALRVVWV